MKELIEQYNNAKPISEWSENNQPDKDLIYRSGVGTQEQKMLGISYVLGLEPPRVISYHTSKSVKLAVPAYHFRKAVAKDVFAEVFMCMRDNFHDLNCTALCSHEIKMNMHDIHSSVTKEWLEKQKQRALNYMRPKPERNLEAHDGYDVIVSAPPDDWGWYETDWSSSRVIKQDDCYFLSSRAYLEGMPREQIHYEGPTNEFTFVTYDYTHVANVICKVMQACRNATYRKAYPEDFE